jgi:hypothetical protein
MVVGRCGGKRRQGLSFGNAQDKLCTGKTSSFCKRGLESQDNLVFYK